MPLEAPPPTVEPSFYAPDFTMTTLNGNTATLSEQRGQWVILNFWATWCVPCVAEMPVLQTLASERAATHVLYGINVREPADLVQSFVAEHGIAFPILINPPDSILTDYAVMGLPQTVVIAPDSKVVWRQFGPLDLDAFSTTLDSLIQSP